MAVLKTVFIINPSAGGRKKDGIRKKIIANISKNFPDSPIEITPNSIQAENIVRMYIKKGYECIAAIGGDGTLNSILQGFFSDKDGTLMAKEVALAVIPLGTGGDFRKTLGIEADPLAALSLLKGVETKKCDVGLVQYTDLNGKEQRRYFLNITSFGISGLVDKYVQESSKKLGGRITFFFATIKAFRNYIPADAEIIVDDNNIVKLKSLLIVIANGMFFGGGMQIAPDACINDGLFKVVIVGNLKLKDFLRFGPQLYGGRKVNHPEIIYTEGKTVSIRQLKPGEDMLLDLDGEPIGKAPAKITIIPSAINIKI